MMERGEEEEDEEEAVVVEKIAAAGGAQAGSLRDSIGFHGRILEISPASPSKSPSFQNRPAFPSNGSISGPFIG